MSISSVVSALISILQIYILARLLTPTDFGVVVIPQVILEVSMAFLTAIPLGIIRQEQYSQKELVGIQTWVHLIALLFFLGLATIALVQFFNSGSWDVFLLMVFGLNLVVASFSLVHRTIIRRELNMKILAIAELAGKLTSFVVTVTLAYMGLQYWSIAFGVLAGSLIRVAYVRRKSGAKISGFGSLNAVPALLRFGCWRGVDQLISKFTARVDRILIGVLLGGLSVGSYVVGSNLVGRPSSFINPMIGGIMYPVFSRISKSSMELYRAFNASSRILSVCSLLIALMFALFADEIGMLLLGPQWVDVFPVLGALGYLFAFMSMEMPCRQVTMAYGDVKRLLFWNVLSALLMSVAFLLAYYFNATLTQFVYAGALVRLVLYITSFPMFAVAYVPGAWSVLVGTILRAILPVVGCSVLVSIYAVESLYLRLLLFAGCTLTVFCINKNLIMNLLPTLRGAQAKKAGKL